AKVRSVTESFNLIGTTIAGFSQRYQEMLEPILERGCSTALSTIYYPRLPDPDLQQIAVTALAFFNDLIISQAIQHGLPVLDLRFICNEDADFANSIEQSGSGSTKIAAAIKRLVLEHDFSTGRTQVFV